MSRTVKIISNRQLIFEVHEARTFRDYSFELDERGGRLCRKGNVILNYAAGEVPSHEGIYEDVLRCEGELLPLPGVERRLTEHDTSETYGAGLRRTIKDGEAK